MSDLPSGYRMLRGSDVERDGMYLELIKEGSGGVIAEVFYSDVTHSMTISFFQSELPLHVIELFIELAKNDLPPMHVP